MTTADPAELTPNRGTHTRDVLRRALRTHVAPGLAAAGLAKHGPREWTTGSRDRGWVAFRLQLDKWGSAERTSVAALTAVWPPGTWESEREDGPPHASASSPLLAGPSGVSARYRPDHEWDVTPATDPDALGEQLLRFLLDDALPWGLARLDVDTALEELASRWRGLHWSVRMLAHAAPHHPQRRELTAAYVEQWLRDPRPLSAGPVVAQLAQEAGLAVPELPVWWSPVFLPLKVDSQHAGDPVAAWRASHPGVLVTLTDGSSQIGLPPTGLGPYGLRAEDLGARRGGAS